MINEIDVKCSDRDPFLLKKKICCLKDAFTQSHVAFQFTPSLTSAHISVKPAHAVNY